jgi:malate dehydrogenase (oxaloacetate-decarboxylating)
MATRDTPTLSRARHLLTCTGEIVAAAAALAPGFGGINLEDISAPRCVEIEDRLRSLLDIPV